MFQQIQHHPTLKIGILRSSAIGDVVLATSLLHLLEQLPIRWEVTWVGKDPSLSLIKSCWPNIRASSLSDPRSSILNNLNNCHFIIDLQNNARSVLLRQQFYFLTKRKTYAPSKMWTKRRFLVTKAYLYGRSQNLKSQPTSWNFQAMVDTLKKALTEHLPEDMHDQILKTEARPQLPINHLPTTTPWLQNMDAYQWLAIAPGASHLPKQAPVQIFTRILEELFQKVPDAWKNNLGLVLLGTREERSRSRQLLDSLSWTPHSLNLAGELSLVETTAILKHCSILLGNDSAPAHLAEAVQTPVSILFGPTTEQFGFAPHSSSSRAFSVPLGCRPCSLHGKNPCRFEDYLCYQGIQADSVAEHIMGQLWRNHIPTSQKPS
ncbi:MAG: glycosyltransferase family 9 protein [Oligoflexales bacterium]